MKTAILTIAIALASAFSALAQTVMRENSTVYFQTNVFLHDNPTNPLHQRLSFEGQEPLWVAASNSVTYYNQGRITNGIIHASNVYAKVLQSPNFTPSTTTYGMRWEGEAGIHNKFGADGGMFFASPFNSSQYYISNTHTNHRWSVGLGSIISNTFSFTMDGIGMTGNFLVNATNMGIGIMYPYAVMNITTGLTINATHIARYTNTVEAKNHGGHLKIVSGSGSYPSTPGGDIILETGASGPNYGRVVINNAKLVAGDMKVEKVYFTDSDAPVYSSWLQSDGTNLFFISTVPPGFTNALTSNTP